MVVPQIIHFSRVFHYKPSILGYPVFGTPIWIDDSELKFSGTEDGTCYIVDVGVAVVFFFSDRRYGQPCCPTVQLIPCEYPNKVCFFSWFWQVFPAKSTGKSRTNVTSYMSSLRLYPKYSTVRTWGVETKPLLHYLPRNSGWLINGDPYDSLV